MLRMKELHAATSPNSIYIKIGIAYLHLKVYLNAPPHGTLCGLSFLMILKHVWHFFVCNFFGSFVSVLKNTSYGNKSVDTGMVISLDIRIKLLTV